MTTEGRIIGIYNEVEIDTLSALGNSVYIALFIQNKIDKKEPPEAPYPMIDEVVLRAVKGGGFGAYRELRTRGLQFEAGEALLEENVLQVVDWKRLKEINRQYNLE